MKSKSSAFIFTILATCFSSSSDAKTTFLPDFEEEPMIFPDDCEGGGEDYCLCQRSTNPKYHLSLDNPQCPSPKIFDKTCPHSDDWITECYCPATYNKICTSPYRGVGEICDGKYEECCDTRCREGTTVGCSYPYVTDYTSSTGCGETCYVCRYGNDCNTSCSAGEETSYSGGYNDFNGQACVTCSTPPPPCTECWCDSSYCEPEPEPEPDPEEPDIPNIPDSPDPDPKPDTPSCTDTCSSKGYSSSQPSGQTCSTTTVCGNTCYYNCKSTDPCAGVTCNGGKTCSNGTCVCPNGKKDCGGSCKNCCSDSDCGSGYTCKNGSCERKTCTDTCAQWRSQPGCQLSPWQSSRTCNDLGTGEGCTDMGCNYLWYCCK